MTLSWITGLSLMLSAIFCGARHMLLNPREDRWANKPAWYRAILFVVTVGLTFLGLHFTSVAISGEISVPPAAGAALTGLSLLLMLYLFGALVETWTKQAWSARVAAILQRPDVRAAAYVNPRRPD